MTRKPTSLAGFNMKRFIDDYKVDELLGHPVDLSPYVCFAWVRRRSPVFSSSCWKHFNSGVLQAWKTLPENRDDPIRNL